MNNVEAKEVGVRVQRKFGELQRGSFRAEPFRIRTGIAMPGTLLLLFGGNSECHPQRRSGKRPTARPSRPVGEGISHSRPREWFQDTRAGAGCTWRSISEILPERLVTSRSKKFWRFSQNSAFVLKYRARRRAVSAEIRRRSCTISPMRVAGTCSSSASLLIVRPSGFIKSSRRTSPG